MPAPASTAASGGAASPPAASTAASIAAVPPPPPLPQPAAEEATAVGVPADDRRTRLEAQLAAVDRGTPDDGRAEQIRRVEDAVNRQQLDLDRNVEQSRRMGCERTGFFLFGGGQPPQCDRLSEQIQRMRSNLDRLMSSLEGLRGGATDRGERRQAILLALAQNACGPQYQATAPRQRGIFESLFGGGAPPPPYGTAPADVPPVSSSTFRTVCVRKCDGSFFPISYSATQARFAEDERACHRACPAADVDLYVYHNPGEEIGQAVSISGQPYTQLPNAF
ncbi:MAG TPA: DUF2865 domain-containing protein, partial [Kofleriaceae bacterium]|nr:DUF2865 domain-containing protein [Kofleriaceae bacterium]